MFTLGIADRKVVRSAISPIHVQWGLNLIRIGAHGVSGNQLSIPGTIFISGVGGGIILAGTKSSFFYAKTFVPFINNLIQCGFSYL